MQPKFNPPQGGSPAVLLCPNCGFDYLHHYRVEVFERKEDEEKGVHVLVEQGKAVIDQNLSGNPSSRRDGLRIQFACEGCSARPVLTIAQHKGNTHVEFTFTEEQ
jgi:hypothetical protein